MSRFIVAINTDNDTFQDGNEQVELARILRRIAGQLEAGEDWAFQTLLSRGIVVGWEDDPGHQRQRRRALRPVLNPTKEHGI